MGLDGAIAGVAAEITGNETVTVVSHIDAYGIASEAILSQALSRAGIPTRSVFVRQLEPLTIHQIPCDGSLKVFLELGAGQQQLQHVVAGVRAARGRQRAVPEFRSDRLAGNAGAATPRR